MKKTPGVPISVIEPFLRRTGQMHVLSKSQNKPGIEQNATQRSSEAPGGHIVAKRASKGKKRGEMNQTETEFSKFLEHKRLEGEIFSWEYEAIMLRWGIHDRLKYSPDFFVIEAIKPSDMESLDYPFVRIVFFEVQGKFKRPGDLRRFKEARNRFPLFRFELWIKGDGGWTQSI